jgi:selenocysteine lyase/cysteine desulfurase
MEAAERIFECRIALASFFCAENPENVIFTPNATAALNLAIKGLLRDGDHVLISDMEHNAVFRPIHRLAKDGRISFDVFSTLVTHQRVAAEQILAEIERLRKPNTRMLVCSHASNICSYHAPLREIGAFCEKRGILFVVDAAQSAGHLPIDVKEMRISALCAPGHKGLLGPQGSGFLIFGEGIVADTLTEGGSGYHSLEADMPMEAPERYEAGTLATPAIVGLLTGLEEVNRRGVGAIFNHVECLNRRLQDQLLQINGISVYVPHHVGAVLLFNIDGMAADRLGYELDRRGFCVRAGFHCAALGHTALGTPAGGAVRVSPGVFNTRAQIDSFASAVEMISQKNK